MDNYNNYNANPGSGVGASQQNSATKICKYCGGSIADVSVICPLCGCQVEEAQTQPQPQYQQPQYQQAPPQYQQPQYQQAPPQYQQPQYQQAPPQYQQPPVIIQNTNTVVNAGKERSKWVALLLCFFLGYLGAHKFYEGKTGMGILYLFTVGLFGIGTLIDFFSILFKPNPYYV